MIIFKNILIEGFGSILEPFPYRLDQSGTNLIFGKNGSGKTTIFSALTWVLYGKTIGGKSVEPWEDVIKGLTTFKGTKVTVKLLVDGKKVKIIRCKNYKDKVGDVRGGNGIFVYVSGIWLEKLRDKKDQQKKIEELLGMSLLLFKSSILFGQKLTRLLSERGPNQKQMFEEAFDVPYIAQGKEKASKDLINTKSLLEDKKQEIEVTKDKIATKKEFIASMETRLMDDLQNVADDIALKENTIDRLNKSKTEYQELRDKEKSIRKNLDSLEKQMSKYETVEKQQFRIDLNLSGEISMVKAKKKEIGDLKISLMSKIKKCNECGQPLDKELFEKQMATVSKNLERCQEEYKVKKKGIKTMKKELKKLDSSIKILESLKDDHLSNRNSLEEVINVGYDTIEYNPDIFKSENKKLKELRKKYDDLKSKPINKEELNKYKTEVKEYKKTLKILKPDRDSLIEEVKLLEWVITDALSNKGLKNYIFQSQLALVNNAMLEYSKSLGFRVDLFIDLESGNKDFNAFIYEGDNIRDYPSLSGGEQQLVDVCLALSIHDVIHKSRSVNLLIMDEIFESLDESNIDMVAELILLKSRNLPLHLVTHRKEFLSSNIDNQISLRRASSGATVIL